MNKLQNYYPGFLYPISIIEIIGYDFSRNIIEYEHNNAGFNASILVSKVLCSGEIGKVFSFKFILFNQEQLTKIN